MSSSVRIVAGEFGGRRLAVPRGARTRPTSDRVREALFSSLLSSAGDAFGRGVGLDAFAGSGALGFEALSRGLLNITFVEKDRSAQNAIRQNIDALGVHDRTSLVAGDVFTLASSGALPRRAFSLLLLDPPYRLASSEIVRLVSTLTTRNLLQDGALIAYEHSSQMCVAWPTSVVKLSQKKYGSTEVEIAYYEGEARSQ